LQIASALSRTTLYPGIDQEILQRFDQQGTETAPRWVGGLQERALQDHEKKILRQILRILCGVATPINECENGAPIDLAELGQAFVGGAACTGSASVPDQTPPRSGEVRQSVFSFQRSNSSHAFSVLKSTLDDKHKIAGLATTG
jgi:hypothetical protein